MVLLEAILLDCDGTIVELHFDYMGARRAIIEFLANRGFERTLFSDRDPIQVTLEKLKKILEDMGQGHLFQDFFIPSKEIMDRFEIEASERTNLMPGALDTIRSLKAMGLKVALVTNSGRKAIELLFRRLLERSLFEAIITRDDVELMKPDPSPIFEALRRLGVLASKAVLVGDSPVDIKAGIAAGVRTVGISPNPEREEILRKAGADYVILSLKELPDLLSRMEGSGF
ncbi:MAG: HAD family phosphatase [Candidatus Bathyarchaeia archaeon]